MKVLVEIPDNVIKQDDLDNESVLSLTEQGIRYLARVSSAYNLENCNIKITIL